METQSPSIKKIALNFGLLLALLSIVLQVIAFVVDAHIERPWWLTVLQLGISISIIVYALKIFKQGNSGYLTLGQAIKIGLAISVIAGIVAVLFNFIFINYIDPEFVAKTMDYSREQMIEQNPNMTQEQIDSAMSISEKFMSPLIMSAFAIIGSLFFGFIISLIAGVIMKRNPPQQF
ncbi:DUF4199 domain-containing protein [Aequorivita echinoideorum]|uniref:DUF4199 family protein n=1 Tax=Aequorivita echinoideorum TaxID=1549647 RepID=A0ABS5S4K3_9FLAO|nr:DUF4199 domain-containing protein [Aequorivita echinoideorum]MBT0608151.1 DUF4199 family protein [Aequorivita echinoideorum]